MAAENIDKPVLIRHGLFGHRFSVISSVGMLGYHDVHGMSLRSRIPTFTASDDRYDEPGSDLGPERRADSLRRLILQKGLIL